jgi:hypothetical protein
MASFLSFLDTPPPFDTEGVPFQCVRAAALAFSASALVAAACPRDWSALKRSYLVALLHGIVSFSLSVPVVLKHWDDLFVWGGDTVPTAERLWFGHGPEYAIPCSVVFGYLAFDFLLGVVLAPGMLDVFMIFHHVVGMVAAVLGCGFGFGVPIHALFVVNEGTTPFTNLHFLHGWTDWRRTLNGLMMFLSFLFLRVIFSTVVIGRIFFYCYAGEGGVRGRGDAHEAVLLAQATMCVALAGLNLMWFWKITKGLIKGLRGGGRGEKKKKEDGEEEGGAAGAGAGVGAGTEASSTSASQSPKEGVRHRAGVAAAAR